MHDHTALGHFPNRSAPFNQQSREITSLFFEHVRLSYKFPAYIERTEQLFTRLSAKFPTVLNMHLVHNSHVEFQIRESEFSPTGSGKWSDSYFCHSVHKISSPENEFHGCLKARVHAISKKRPLCLTCTRPYSFSNYSEQYESTWTLVEHKCLLNVAINGVLLLRFRKRTFKKV